VFFLLATILSPFLSTAFTPVGELQIISALKPSKFENNEPNLLEMFVKHK
jgi:hypothetical protein